jgi:diacylglycerol kinase (ATP)
MRVFVVGRFKSMRCAGAGVVTTVRSQRNAWLHLVATVAAITLGCALRLSTSEWCWIVTAIGAVWVAELMNTAIEILCDVVSPEFNAGIGRAKDAAAGAVLMAAITAALIGVCVFGPHLVCGWGSGRDQPNGWWGTLGTDSFCNFIFVR